MSDLSWIGDQASLVIVIAIAVWAIPKILDSYAKIKASRGGNGTEKKITELIERQSKILRRQSRLLREISIKQDKMNADVLHAVGSHEATNTHYNIIREDLANVNEKLQKIS